MVDSYVCTLQMHSKRSLFKKSPPLPMCSNCFCLLKHQCGTVKGHFDFSPLPSSRTQPALWYIEAVEQERDWQHPPTPCCPLSVLHGQMRLRAEGGHPHSYLPWFMSPDSNSKLLNHRLPLPDSKAEVNIPLLLKPRWLSFINAQSAARKD